MSRGNRNPYMVLWAPVPIDPLAPAGPATWQLFASENGPDFNDAPDEVNHIRWHHNYGFPTNLDQWTGPTAQSMASRTAVLSILLPPMPAPVVWPM
ncbi:MAG: hypothetical protein R2867_33840 [Caldilineaceae bacterium]